MGLTQKILLFTAGLVVTTVAAGLGFSTLQSERLARTAIAQGLDDTRGVWQAYEADRFAKLKLGVRVLSNDPYFKAAVVETDQPTILDALRERGRDMRADFLVATGADGHVVARTDRPKDSGEDLSSEAIVKKPLEGEEASTVWRLGDHLFHAVAVPMETGPSTVGVLVAGYEMGDALAGQIQKLTRSEVAFLLRPEGEAPRIVGSSLGSSQDALREALAAQPIPAGEAPFDLDLAGERHVGIQIPLRSAEGSVVGDAIALRSWAVETAAFRSFRRSLVFATLAVMVVALGVAAWAARRITGPVRSLAGLVERVRDGSYTGQVAVATRDEIGVLASAFNALLSDLRQKDQMITFLREGQTIGGDTPGGTLSSTMGVAADAAAAGQRARLEAGTVFAGRYEILDTVGRGGMGVVYRALDRQLDEVVALKVLRSEPLAQDPTALDRFKSELKLARRITHRNVLRTHDFGHADGTSFISMEYVEGVSLKDLIRRRGALPLAVGLSVAKQMCYGLEAAHQGGVIHRDVKPQNMLIVPETGDLKIMDFGIARVSELEKSDTDRGLTQADFIMGTPDYIPPEQAQGRPADFRSDIYSLGIVLFEVFTGKLPFRGNSALAVIMAHVQKAPPVPRSFNSAVPEALEALILRCVEKDPARRFPRVGEVLGALTALSARSDAA